MDSIAQLQGLSDDDLAQTFMRGRWSPHFVENLKKIDQKVAITGKPLTNYKQLPYLSKFGVAINYTITKIPIIDQLGEFQGILTLSNSLSNLDNIEYIIALYQQLYPNKTEAHKNILIHLGLYDEQQQAIGNLPTLREIEVLVAFHKYKTIKICAQHLNISPRTFEKHFHALMTKLPITDKSEIPNYFQKLSQHAQQFIPYK
jgi:DNA-binding CsgD family transcriptional regulator